MAPLLLDNPYLRPFFYWFGKISLFLLGWETRGKMSDLKKAILIAAPHSTNWDFVYFLLIVFKLQISVHWMGKASMFIWPFQGLLKRLGGIPVDRSKKGNLVETMVETIQAADHMIITIAPSGTRQRVSQWKTGFYHIARQADIPLVCGFVDYTKRQGGIGPVFFPTGDMEGDLMAIKDFYKDKAGKYPEYGASNES